MLRFSSAVPTAGFAVSFVSLASGSALAVDGEITLSQEIAVNGGVSAGDAPGFPITISASGRYRFTTNLMPPAAIDGIVIDADNVSVDFDGFTLDGVGHAATGVASARNSIEIKNGVITGFEYFGIDSRAAGKFWTISNMRVLSNGFGVTAGAYARVVGNNISSNGNYGLACEYCLIEGNVVALNYDDGIDVKGGAVLGNMIASNRGYGISAFMLAYTLTGYGNNTLVKNNGSGSLSPDGRFIEQRPQTNGRLRALQPNVE